MQLEALLAANLENRPGQWSFPREMSLMQHPGFNNLVPHPPGTFFIQDTQAKDAKEKFLP